MDAAIIRGSGTSRPRSVAVVYILSDNNAKKQTSTLNLYTNLYSSLFELKLCSEATASDLRLFFGVTAI